MNAVVDALTAMGAGLCGLNTAFAGGADPTGAADSTAAIQGALNAASPGQSVSLPAGTYLYSSSITIPAGVGLIGDSQSFGIPIANYGAGGLPLQGTILKASSSFANPNSATGTLLMTQASGQGGGQRLSGISVDCSNLPNGNNLHGLLIQNNTACVTLRDVTIYGGTRQLGGDVVHAVASAGSPPDLLDFAFCHFAGGAGYGVTMSGVADSYLTACESTANGLGAWNVINGNNTRFTGCKGETSTGGPGWLFTAFTGFTGIVHLNACTAQSNFGDGFKFTGAGTGIYQMIACSSDDDGLNAGSGGGGFAGLQVSSFAGTVLADGFNVRVGTSPACPQYGVAMTSSNTVKVDNAVLAGTTSATHDGGGNTIFQIGLGAGLLTTAGDTAYQGSTGLARLAGNATAQKQFLSETSGVPSWSVVPGQFLATPSQYAPGSLATLAVTSLTFAAFSSANVNTGSFTGPASGSVLVTASFVAQQSTAAAATAFALAAHGTVTPLVGNAVQGSPANITTNQPTIVQFLVTGLTPGASYNFDLLGATGSASDALNILALQMTATTITAGNRGGPVIMTVQAV